VGVIVAVVTNVLDLMEASLLAALALIVTPIVVTLFLGI
jgi:hypothetical protein